MSLHRLFCRCKIAQHGAGIGVSVSSSRTIQEGRSCCRRSEVRPPPQNIRGLEGQPPKSTSQPKLPKQTIPPHTSQVHHGTNQRQIARFPHPQSHTKSTRGLSLFACLLARSFSQYVGRKRKLHRQTRDQKVTLNIARKRSRPLAHHNLIYTLKDATRVQTSPRSIRFNQFPLQYARPPE